MERKRAIIQKTIEERGKATSGELAEASGVTRQYAHMVLMGLAENDVVMKIGGTRDAFYVTKRYVTEHPDILPCVFRKTYRNEKLEEHAVLHEIERGLHPLKILSENVRSMFTFAFSEMFNNAIEHSNSKTITVHVALRNDALDFVVSDSGIGVFRNIMKQRGLATETEAMQDLLKGKTTTMPTSHSGEGIFFTSKIADVFFLDSFGYRLTVNTIENDVTITTVATKKRGTRVVFSINQHSNRHLTEVFNRYANVTADSDYGFDKTEIRVKLYTVGGVTISRSQARRILSGLDKFKIIVFDYDHVPLVGQAFADEIYRVFQRQHRDIRIENEHMSDGVRFMVERAKTEATRSK